MVITTDISKLIEFMVKVGSRRKWKIVPAITGLTKKVKLEGGLWDIGGVKIPVTDLPEHWHIDKKKWHGELLIVPERDNPVYSISDKLDLSVRCKKVFNSIPIDFLSTSYPYSTDGSVEPFPCVPFYTESGSIRDTLAAVNTIYRELSVYINEVWEISGLIITNDDVRILCAFNGKEALTTLIRIEFGVTKNGELTATAILDPISIDGEIISSAPMHFHKGTSFKTPIRAGDIVRVAIPDGRRSTPKQIEVGFPSSSSPITVPDKCPSCNALLVMEDGLTCSNYYCSEALIKKLIHFCASTNMGIGGIGKQLATILVETNQVRTVNELYRLTEQDLSSVVHSSGVSAAKVIAGIQGSRHCKLDKVISGLGIYGIGAGNGKLLAWLCGDLCELLTIHQSEVTEVLPLLLDTKIINRLKKYLSEENNQKMLLALHHELVTKAPSIVSTGHDLVGKSIAVNGDFHPYTKEMVEDHVTDAGAIVTENVFAADYIIRPKIPTAVGTDNGRYLVYGQFLIKVLN